MAIATFDGPNRRIVLTPPLGESNTSLDIAVDVYSEWKRWVLEADNSKYPQAMRSTGGDELGGGLKMGSYIFLENHLGWRVKPGHENADLHSIELVGNLFPEDPNQSMFEWTAGVNVVISMMRSSLTQVVSTGGSALTQQEHDQLMGLPGATLETDERAALFAVEAKTNNLPGSIGRARALTHFHVLMVGSVDHRTPATGLTVTAELAKDDGAFVALAGAVVEIGSGIYDLSLTADETNCVSGTLLLTADGADTRYISFVTSP